VSIAINNGDGEAKAPGGNPDGFPVSAIAAAAHCAAWLGGILLALTPFIHRWRFPLAGMSFSARIWPGNLLVEITAFLLMIFLGGLLAGMWWWAAAAGRKAIPGAAGSIVLFGIGMAAIAGAVSPWPWLLVLTCYACWGVASRIAGPRRHPQAFGSFLRTKTRWNAVFFLLLIAGLTLGDALLIQRVRPNWHDVAIFLTLRILTYTVLAALLWLALALFARWSPWPHRLFGPIVLAAVLLLAAADTVLRLMWSKGLLMLFAELDVGGYFDLRRAVEGGGVTISPALIAAAVGAFFAALALIGACRWVSGRFRLSCSPAGLFILGAGAWLALLVVQSAEAKWTSASSRKWAHRTCVFQLAPFALHPGAAHFDVEFKNPQAPESASLTRKPDIFLFIIETFRADAMRREIAPTLCRWRDQECQEFARTFSASNATHLSWFSLLHGKPSVFWNDDRTSGKTAPLPAILRRAGYRTEVRATADLYYSEMMQANFIGPDAPDVVEHYPPEHPGYSLSMGERELDIVGRLEASVKSPPAGPAFRLCAFDAPHYPYKWHRGFQPPLAEFDPDPLFPIAPSPEQIAAIVRRYWNSVAWVDHMMTRMLEFLKQQGKYDESIIILTGDHGEEFKEHGCWFHCSALTKEQTQVPLLVKWPKSWGRGPALPQASHTDLLPSLLHAMEAPPESWQSLPGNRWLAGTELTSVSTTNFASQDGEAMIWRRGGWEAAFSWLNPWKPGVPQRIWLDRISGPDGEIDLPSTPEKCDAMLREKFPDVLPRFFARFDLTGNS
jgi:glucan phosphoethanolaminetransferase (alkaline phosphatase superfamily)